MVTPERLTDDMTGPQRDGHEFRYHVARGFVDPGATVVDSACGTGYGATILLPHGGSAQYVGVDLEPHPDQCCSSHSFVQADLMDWRPNFSFDLGVSFETIEHVPNYQPLVNMLKQARQWIIASVPVVPTVGLNPYHLHDFVPGDLVRLFEDDDWRCFQLIGQRRVPTVAATDRS